MSKLNYETSGTFSETTGGSNLVQYIRTGPLSFLLLMENIPWSTTDLIPIWFCPKLVTLQVAFSEIHIGWEDVFWMRAEVKHYNTMQTGWCLWSSGLWFLVPVKGSIGHGFGVKRARKWVVNLFLEFRVAGCKIKSQEFRIEFYLYENIHYYRNIALYDTHTYAHKIMRNEKSNYNRSVSFHHLNKIHIARAIVYPPKVY